MRKRIISIVLTICLVAGMLFAGAVSAGAWVEKDFENGTVVYNANNNWSHMKIKLELYIATQYKVFDLSSNSMFYLSFRPVMTNCTFSGWRANIDGADFSWNGDKWLDADDVFVLSANVGNLGVGWHTITATADGSVSNGGQVATDSVSARIDIEFICNHTNGHAKQTGHADATCTADGYTSYKCDLCSKEWTDKIPMLGHSFTQFVQTVAPTCADRGYNIYKCERCEATENRDYTEINPDNHASLKSTVTPPTCTTDGYTDYSCSSCGKSWRGDPTNQLNHDFSVYQYTVAPNCISQGYTVYKCSRCTITENRDFTERDYSNHANAYEITTVAPTCTDQGYTNYGCSSCGATWTGNIVAATGHSYNDGEVTTSPTCTTDGVKTLSCTKCSAQKTEPVAKLGHSYKVTVVAPSCESGGYTKHECIRCASAYFDNKTNPNSHQPAQDFVTVVPASCFGVGVKVKYCNNCGKAVEVEEIPAGAHNPVEIPPVAATYESTGLTAGSKCSVCETILLEQQVTPKLTPPTEETNTQQGQDNTGTVHGETEQIDEKFTFDFFGIIKWIFENIIMKIFFIK